MYEYGFIFYCKREIFRYVRDYLLSLFSALNVFSVAVLESEGKTVVAVFEDKQLVGLIAVADTLRENAKMNKRSNE